MPIQILWGNDLNAQNTFIQKLIDKEVSKEWKEINVTNLNGDDDEQVNKAFHVVKYSNWRPSPVTLHLHREEGGFGQ